VVVMELAVDPILYSIYINVSLHGSCHASQCRCQIRPCPQHTLHTFNLAPQNHNITAWLGIRNNMAGDRMHVTDMHVDCATPVGHTVFQTAEVIPLVKMNFYGHEIGFHNLPILAIHGWFLLPDTVWPLILNTTNICPILPEKCKYHACTGNSLK